MTLSAADLAAALGGKQHGSYWTARCPAHDDREASLSIRDGETAPIFKCFAGCERADIIAALRARQLWNGQDLDPPPPAAIRRAKPAPQLLRSKTLVHPQFGKPLYRHDYLAADGSLRFVVCRWEPPAKEKIVRPAAPHPAAGWEWLGPTLEAALASPRPLYRMAVALAETECGILIVEGEKKADIAAKLFLEWVVIAWSGGVAGVACSDWSSLPAGRKVVGWPDNDPPGIKAMRLIAQKVPGMAVVDLDSLVLPPKWDLGDQIPAELDVESIVNRAKVPVFADPIPSGQDMPPWEPPGETKPTEFVSRALFVDELRRQPRPEYLIKGIIDRGAFAEIFGPYGVGKSFLAIDIGIHLACGISWRGLRTRQCGVLYVCGEGSMLNRLDAWELHHVEKLDTAPILSVIAPVNLLHVDGVDQLIADATRVPDIGAIFIDTAARATPGSDEGPEAMSILVAACDRIRSETRAAVILVHHAGKDTSRGSRGSTVLPAAVDAMIEVSQDAAGFRCATIAKSREGETGAEYPFELVKVELGTDTDGDPFGSMVAIPAGPRPPRTKRVPLGKNQELGLLILKDAGRGLTQDEWNTRMKDSGIVDKQRWSEIRLKLKDRNLVYEHQERWFLTYRRAAGQSAPDTADSPAPQEIPGATE